MTSSAAAIISDLRHAFPAKRAGRFPVVNSVQGDEPARVETDFAEKDDWTTLEPEWLDRTPDGFSSALSFLTDEAIRFYIPAFISADLVGGLQRVDPTFVLVHGFDRMALGYGTRTRKAWTDASRARWDEFSREQAAAIVHYLEWRIEREGIDIGRGIVEALGSYWYPRAAGLRSDLM